MSQLVRFLENVGANAALRHADRSALLAAMAADDAAATEVKQVLDAPGDVGHTLYCALFKTPDPKKAPSKTPAKAPPPKTPAKKPPGKGKG